MASSDGEAEVLEEVVLWLARIFIVVGGAIPYVPQYIQIMNTQDGSGFSTMVCFVVILSNVLRIAYWFGRAFDTALLCQSVLMTVFMLVILELCLRVERKRAERAGILFQEHYFLVDFNPKMFWEWTTIWSYVQATLFFLTLSCSYTIAFSPNPTLIEPVGYAALLLEACLALPQLLRNYSKKSTQGMNIMMVVLWTLGDSMKGLFFFVANQPLPFKLCAVIQVILDLSIFVQVYLYSQ